MAYLEHMTADREARLAAPSGPETVIWRYMSLGKFVALLSTRCLHFCRADLFGDPFEGTLSPTNLGADEEPTEGNTGYTYGDVRHWFRTYRRRTYVNCWHLHDSESAAMWAAYGSSWEAVAVRSSYGRLRECLESSIEIGTVRYIGYDSRPVPFAYSWEPFLYKRREFEHERELRAVTLPMHPIQFGGSPPPGILEAVNLERLILDVRLAPRAPQWFGRAVASILHWADLKVDVAGSSMDSTPEP